MKKKIFLITLIVMVLVCIFAVSVSAESAYVNANGEQVEAGSSDIAYEIEFKDVWNTTGNCRLTYIYLYDTSITKLVIPEIEFINSKGTVYKMAEYSYVRLSTGWGDTQSVYALDDKETKTTSLHTQIKEIEFHIPVLCDGAGSQGNLANWTGLEKLSFFNKAYETQSKGGFLSGCTSLREIHFYGANNTLTSNFFPSTMVAGSKIVFHENATGTIRSTAMQNINGKDVTVYLNQAMSPADSSDPRLTWNKNGNGLLKFVLLVNDKSGYTEEQIASYQTTWQAGNNKSANNSTYSMPIMTYCDYYGKHLDMNALSSCVSKCLTCNVVAIPENPVHNMNVAIEYADYTKAGTITTMCLNDSCPHNVEPTVENAPALFTVLGYSSYEVGLGGIVSGFVINLEAIEEYEELTGKTLKYGAFAVSSERLGENEIFNQDGTVAQGVIKNDITERDFGIFELRITGIEDEHKDAKLCLGAYVAVTDGDTTDYSYMQDKTSGEVVGNYYAVSFNDLANKQ